MNNQHRSMKFPIRETESLEPLANAPVLSDTASSDAERIQRMQSDIDKKMPGLFMHEPTALLLDINNLYKVADYNGFRIDYSRLRAIFEKRCDLRYSAAYSAIDYEPKEDGSVNGSVQWADWMEKRGYTMVTKDLKRYKTKQGDLVTKGNMDINLTIGAMKLSPSFGHIIIGTCDGDFIPLIDALQEGNYRKVSLLAITSYDRSGLDQSLKNKVLENGGHFYDLAAIRDHIEYKSERRRV